jgi:hypothetical protein
MPDRKPLRRPRWQIPVEADVSQAPRGRKERSSDQRLLAREPDPFAVNRRRQHLSPDTQPKSPEVGQATTTGITRRRATLEDPERLPHLEDRIGGKEAHCRVDVTRARRVRQGVKQPLTKLQGSGVVDSSAIAYPSRPRSVRARSLFQ